MDDEPTANQPHDVPEQKPDSTSESLKENVRGSGSIDCVRVSLTAQQDDQVDDEAVENEQDEGADKSKEQVNEQPTASANDGTPADASNEAEPASKDPEPPAVDAPASEDRFEALVRDRDSLRAEVTDMRKSLEEIQSKHRSDTDSLQGKLDDAETKKEHAETQFQKLMERVNTIKAQLGERLKEDSVRQSVRALV